jgi:hypothetical protein
VCRLFGDPSGLPKLWYASVEIKLISIVSQEITDWNNNNNNMLSTKLDWFICGKIIYSLRFCFQQSRCGLSWKVDKQDETKHPKQLFEIMGVKQPPVRSEFGWVAGSSRFRSLELHRRVNENLAPFLLLEIKDIDLFAISNQFKPALNRQKNNEKNVVNISGPFFINFFF